jgi:DNA-binding NtrC family response regulator
MASFLLFLTLFLTNRKIPVKILVIDDDPQVITYLSKRLGKWGFAFNTAQDGPHALKALAEEDFDLAFLDIYLGDTTALDLIPKMKSINPDIGIVTMTGNSNRELEMKIRALGILYYMEKPIESNGLKLLLDHVNTKKDTKNV